MKRFSNILLTADAARADSIALRRATTLAPNNQASLTLVDSVDSIPTEMQIALTAITSAELVDMVVSEKPEQLEKVVTCSAKSGVDIETNVLIGKPFLEVIRKVLRNRHDLVIRRVEPSASVKDVLLGSTDMHLMRKCPCPVWIIKPPEHKHIAAYWRRWIKTRRTRLKIFLTGRYSRCRLLWR